MKRGNLIIIPDENQILSPIFSEDIIGKDAHNNGIEKFIKKYYPNTPIQNEPFSSQNGGYSFFGNHLFA